MLWVETALVFGLVISVRAATVGHDPIHDELYHLLAGRSWAESGTFSIADGSYDRAALYTMLVGVVYKFFGDSIDLVRFSSVLTGSLWVALSFVWAYKELGRPTAWLAALLFCFAPGAIFLSQYIRFYALHGLLFFVGAVCLYSLVEHRHSALKTALIGVVGALALAVAAHLQVITLIGLAGACAWITYRSGPTIWRRFIATTQGARWLHAVVVAAATAVTVGLFVTGIPQSLYAGYREPLPWSTAGPLMYHWLLVSQYPVLWAAAPLAAVFAVAKRSAPATFCAFLFLISILLHSFAGAKAERFIYYLMPFFFISTSFLAVRLIEFIKSTWDSALRGWGLRVAEGPLRFIGFLVAAAPFVVANPAIRTTFDIVSGTEAQTLEGNPTYWSVYRSDWTAASNLLRQLIEDSSVVVTSQGLHVLYYFGRHDIELLRSSVQEEFQIDPRLGRPTISTGASFLKIRSCYPSGMVVIHDNAWRHASFVPTDAADAIEQTTNEFEVPNSLGLKVFYWDNAAIVRNGDCQSLPRFPTIGPKQIP